MLVVFCFVICHSLVGTFSWAHNLFCSDVSVSGLINDTSLLSPCLALSVSSLEHACMCQFLLRAIASNPIILDSCGLKKLKTQIKNQPSAYALDAIFTYQLTNGLHFAVGLFSNRSNMTSRCGWLWCPCHILTSPVIYCCADPRHQRILSFYNKTKQKIVSADVIWVSVLQ